MSDLQFTPSRDTAKLLHMLLDIFEQRNSTPRRAVTVKLQAGESNLPGYYSQIDPVPRITTNEQLMELEKLGAVELTWGPGQEGHLLAAVTLKPIGVSRLYTLLDRQPLNFHRMKLRGLLLGNRFRVHDWRALALDHILRQLEDHKSPAPFILGADDWNQDLLDALLALPPNVAEELPYRVFSVRVFNDSKRFETLKRAVARMAKRHHMEWRDLNNHEILRELGLVPNPSHLHMYGPWRLVDGEGQIMRLGQFTPSVGIPATLVAHITSVEVEASRVICVENLTTFYELVQHEEGQFAALCLWGNPSPACRHLLRILIQTLPENVPLQLWADMDYGGFNILLQLRQTVSRRFVPYRMDTTTLETFSHWGQPITPADRRNLERLRDHPLLSDVTSTIDTVLRNEVKLEQEAIQLNI